MATLVKKPNGKWLARVRRVGHPIQQKVFSTKGAAQQWARVIEADWDGGGQMDVTSSRRVRLCDMLETYLTSHTSTRCGRESARAVLLDPIAYLSASKLSISDINDYIRRMQDVGYSGSTIAKRVGIIYRVFVLAGQLGFGRMQNPAVGVVKPKEARARDRRLRGGELDRLLAVCSPDLEAIVRFAIATGMRRGEILSLEWRNINPCERVAHLRKTKNGDARGVPLGRTAMRVLFGLPKPRTGRVFWKEGPYWFDKLFKLAVQEAGLEDFRFHDLRHEAISRLYERTRLRDVEIAKAVGHKTLDMTKRYTHLRARDIARMID